MGLQWSITDNTRLRLAAFRTLKPRLAVQQTIEPTQVAGFNQFFDEPFGTIAENYGIGLDFRLTDSLYAGVEGVRRDLEIPIFVTVGTPLPIEGNFLSFDGRDESYFGYLYWIPHPQWVIRNEYRVDKYFESGEIPLPPEFGISSFSGTYQVDTISVPLMIRYFSLTGLFGELGTTYVHQKVKKTGFLSSGMGSSSDRPFVGSENFILFDAAIGYRLPKRWGILSLEVKNLFDKKFHFEDVSEMLTPNLTRELGNPRFAPERLVLAQFTLNF